MARGTKANAKQTETTNTTESTAPATETKKDITTVDLSKFGDNKSAKIRALNAEGFDRSSIAKHLGIKYQFVRNVLVQAPPKAKQPEAAPAE